MLKLFVLILIFISYNPSNELTIFCTSPTSNFANEADFPRFPNEFETKVMMSSNSLNVSSDVVILFDSYRQRGELIISENGNTLRRIYYFDQDEFFNKDEKCLVSKISSANDLFFGNFEHTLTGIVMQSASSFFHFNNGFPIVKLPQEIKRGIPVNHFRSCQNWTQLDSNFQIDFYFQVAQFKQGLLFDPAFKEILVEIDIEGYSGINKFKRTYSFYEFRSIIEHRQDLYTQPSGVYCEKQAYEKKVPEIPADFSFFLETVSQNDHKAISSQVFYSYSLNAIRTDLPEFKIEGIFDTNQVKVIHDYNSGVGFVINKENGNCTTYPLNPEMNEINVVSSNFGSFFELKKPNDYFGLETKAYYAGQRYERGILCDVYVSNRTDLFDSYPDVKADYFVYEVYFLSANHSIDFISSDKREKVVPISTRISAPGTNFALINHIYDFDTRFHRLEFDVSQCFGSKHTKRFGIKYDYPLNIDRNNFTLKYGSRLAEVFDKAILSKFTIFNSSPLRLVETKIEPEEKGFVVYSGVHNFAPPINHFKKFGHPKIDINKAQRAIKSSSAAHCAKLCLNESVYDVFNYKCLSFDYCKNSDHHICSFYNQSLITDPAIQTENNTTLSCSHYSKLVKNVDGVDVDTLYRSVKENVVKNLLDLQITDEKTITFSSTEIFEYTFTQINSIGSSFFQQFKLYSQEYDFDITNGTNSTYLVRKKTGISINECSRLCLDEFSFNCQSLTYSSVYTECKWSALELHNSYGIKNSSFFYLKKSYKLFFRDVLYNYIEYPFKMTTNLDYIVIDNIDSPEKCASKCNKETNFICRSFNLCKDDNKPGSFKCLLSSSNIHRNINITKADKCSHYSKTSLSDFELVPNQRLQVKPKSVIVGVSVESCSESCVSEYTYMCRSFDYNLKSNQCFLYEENIKDEIFIDLKRNQSSEFNHYSRLYFEKDGVQYKIESKGLPKQQVQFSSGTIFGVVIGLICTCLILGILLGFVYFKLTKKPAILPVLRYVNPNYQERKNQPVY